MDRRNFNQHSFDEFKSHKENDPQFSPNETIEIRQSLIWIKRDEKRGSDRDFAHYFFKRFVSDDERPRLCITIADNPFNVY